MKKNDIFNHISDDDAAKIAAEYPTGDKNQRDRLFREVEKRVNGSFSADDEVRGVDTYRPRIAMKIISAAAAFVLIAGVARGGYHLLIKDKRSTENSSVSDISEPSTVEETIFETAAVSEQITKEEILEKIYSRNYESFDRINMKYRENMNGISFMDGIIKRDGSTGNESVMKTWTHTPEYFEDIDTDILERDNTTPEELAQTSTHNEMFFVKDMFICIYNSTSKEGPGMYEILKRSTYTLDRPTIFSDTYSERLIRDLIEHFDIQDITENTSFIGRNCTEVFMTYIGSERSADEAASDLPMEPKMASEEDDLTTFNSEYDQELSLTIDNETGFILKAKLSYDDYYEEFEVNELLFNDNAELPENGEYIRNHIAECEPLYDDLGCYDLSVID